MGNNRDILAQYAKEAEKEVTKVENTYLMGIKKMRNSIRSSDIDLKKFRRNLTTQGNRNNTAGKQIHESDDDGPSSSDL
ncbi:hypothetical protein PGT21_028376 [Puccinia graminis f. sp. tritici]|uniref:Uncharacterized protein n=1 Tax=Puccinia graminis f. sp. tritici TaxID=56615 RepID=A0A5B0Q6R8_PUCGR|nr:hypothetical protein PGT21_028376 [Puccinia graminis f. sp. tritici]